MPINYAHNTASSAAGAPERPATDRQVSYVAGLGGDPAAAVLMTRMACSRYITLLQREGSLADRIARKAPRPTGAPSTPPTGTPLAPSMPFASSPAPPVAPVEEEEVEVKAPRKEVPAGFLELLDKGYYAVSMEEGDPLRFFYVSKPTSGTFKGCIKVQSQHSDTWKLATVLWPSGKVSTYREYQVEYVLAVIADQIGCALTYAEEIGNCARCNKTLTDERSRYYGIGPECEKYKASYIEEVELKKGAYKA